MDSQAITGQTKRRGFNLIEAAIVLGIVGAVIGGIWVAASAVMESQKINTMASEILQAVYGTRKLVNYSSYPTDMNGFVALNTTIVAAGILPENLLNDLKLKTPWGGNWHVGLGNYTGINRIHVTLEGSQTANGIDQNRCKRITNQLLNKIGRKGDIYSIYVSTALNTGVHYYPPYSINQITCPSTIWNIQFQFKP